MGSTLAWRIYKKFDKANCIVDSYMIYEKAERLKFLYRFLKLVFGCGMFFYIVAALDIIAKDLRLFIFVFYISS